MKKLVKETVTHPLPPIYDKNSTILILGSFPSRKTRELNFYYGHPQNQFWHLLEDVFEEKIIDKKQFLLDHHIALFDVVKKCDIVGSSDSTIKNVIPNDINYIIKNSQIKTVYVTGKKALELYQKYLEKETNLKAIYLPSPSPLNQTLSYQEKLKKYLVLKKVNE